MCSAPTRRKQWLTTILRPSKDCLADETNGFMYRFLGGAPGWEVLKLPPTVETEIRIYTDGEAKAELIYNCFPR